MKKKLILLVSIVLAICCLLTSCEEEKSINVYTVTFKGIDGIATQEVLEGGKATEPALTNQDKNSMPGFAFEGWTLDGDEYDFSSTVTKNIVLVAKWGVECRITFDSNGGSAVDAVTVPYYTNVTKPANPTRRGYTFKYWEIEDEEGPYEYNFNGQPVYESFELKAVWEPKTITVKYVVGDAVIDETTTEVCGNTTTIKDFPSSNSNLTWKGHAFVGWSFNGKEYHAGDTITVEANATGSDEVMTLTAVWKSDYKVGDVGPSGGVIIYVNDDENSTWKYIESAPSPLSESYCFGYYIESSNINAVIGTTTEVGAGKANTKTIVDKLGDSAETREEDDSYKYIDENGEEKTKNIHKRIYAAKACYDYSVKNSNNMTYDDWYLPSKEEFTKLYEAYFSSASGRKKLETGSYITSSEVDVTYCWTAVIASYELLDSVYIKYRTYDNTDRGGLHSVWPVRYF